MEGCILLLAPLRKASGNHSTINRIKSHLEKNGHRCVLTDSEALNNNVSSLDEVYTSHQVRLIIALHAYKSGRFIKDTSLPFILIFGGTDINVNSKDPAKLQIMTAAVKAASHIVSFSDGFLQQARKLWSCISSKSTFIIKQAVTTCPSEFSLIRHLKKLHQPSEYIGHENLKVFLFVGGIRPVKNPLYLVKAFEELHSRRPHVLYVILGPVMEEEYTEAMMKEIKSYHGVIYVPELSLPDTHAAIRDSFALVNSSESEGMPITPLEAMHLGTTVIARDIPGNRSVINDGETGLLYDSPEECIIKAESLIDDIKLRNYLVTNAKRFVSEQHSVEEEEKAYLRVVNTAING